MSDDDSGGELHLLGFASTIWHTIRFPNSWQIPFGNVNAAAGHPDGFQAVAAAAVAGDLHVVGLTEGAFGSGGTIWHAIRRADLTWQSFQNVNDLVGNPGGTIGFTACAVGAVGTDMHMIGRTVDVLGINPTIWHTIWHPDQTWQAWGNVSQVVGNPGGGPGDGPSNMAITGVGDDLHLVSLDGSGTIWHTIRFSDQTWQSPFGNVSEVVGVPDGYNPFFACAVTAVNDDLHLAAIASGTTGAEPTIFQTIRFAEATWQSPFGNVNQIVGDPSGQVFTAVAVAGVDAGY